MVVGWYKTSRQRKFHAVIVKYDPADPASNKSKFVCNNTNIYSMEGLTKLVDPQPDNTTECCKACLHKLGIK